MNKGSTHASRKSTPHVLNGKASHGEPPASRPVLAAATRDDDRSDEGTSVTIPRIALENMAGLVAEAREKLVIAAGLFALVDGDRDQPHDDVREEFNEAVAEAALAIACVRSDITALQDGTHHTYTDAQRWAAEDKHRAAQRADERDLAAAAARVVDAGRTRKAG